MTLDLKNKVSAALAADTPSSSDFDLNPEVVLPPNRKLRDAAVLIPIYVTPTDTRMILTKRSSKLKHHAGQIAFPGGKVDPEDADHFAAALREADEEIGLPRDAVDILGTLPSHETVTGFRVTPVVGLITHEFVARPEAGEVDEVFSVPLSHVISPQNFIIEGRMWQGTKRRYYTVPFGPYYIWGATARMLRGFADRMQSCG